MNEIQVWYPTAYLFCSAVVSCGTQCMAVHRASYDVDYCVDILKSVDTINMFHVTEVASRLRNKQYP